MLCLIFIQRSAAAVAEMAETVRQATRAAEEGLCQTDAGMYFFTYRMRCCFKSCMQQQCICEMGIILQRVQLIPV